MFLTFAVFPRDRFLVEACETGYLQSSIEGRRHFCRDCGSPLFSEWSDTDSFDLDLGALDEPHELRPTYELLWNGRAPWLADMPALLRFDHNPPPGVVTPSKES